MNKKSICKYSGKCNGCQLLNLDYAEQLSYKQKRVESLLGNFGKVDKTVGSDSQFAYRNKATYVFDTTKSGAFTCGIYNSKSGNVTSVKKCRLTNDISDGIANSAYSIISSLKIQPFNQRVNKGVLRYITIRTTADNQVLVFVVTESKFFDKKEEFVRRLLKVHPEITTIVHGVNGSDKPIFTEEIVEVLYGDGTITDELCSKKFMISPTSFYQINRSQTQNLYKKAIELAKPKPSERILDAYCGIGTIALCISDYVKEAVGFEINPFAVENARENIKLNNAKNVSVYNCDATKFTADDKFDTVFLDPPRAGCSYGFIKTLIKISPKKIVYISCNSQTQRRDLFQLTKKGYTVQSIHSFDMFPNTSHIETIVLLTKDERKR